MYARNQSFSYYKIGKKNDVKSSSRARNNYREQKLGEKRNGSKVIQITRRAQSRHLQNHHPLTTHVAKNRREQWRSLIVSPVNTGTNFNCCPSESFFLAPGGGLIVKKATRCITRDNWNGRSNFFFFLFFFFHEIVLKRADRFLFLSNGAKPLTRCAFVITWSDLFSSVHFESFSFEGGRGGKNVPKSCLFVTVDAFIVKF